MGGATALAAAERRQQRGRRRLGAGQRPRAATTSTTTPTRTRASPGQTEECEAGNEPYMKGQTVIGNAPGNQGHDDLRPAQEEGGTDGSPARERRQSRAGKPRHLRLAPEQRGDRVRLPGHHHRSARTWPSPNTFPSPATATKLKATFANGVNISTNSPVRVAGVDVGKVIAAEREGDATTVTFTVEGSARPIHDDAFAEIRPRIFLEGNFFIELDPGSPSAPELDSGGTIPVSHTSTAVQLDEILTALQSPGSRRPRSPAGGLRHRAQPHAERRRRRHAAPRGPGA